MQTQNGVLQGRLKILENGQSYYSFLGIPYAQPPVGNLRFRVMIHLYLKNNNKIVVY